MLRYQGEQKQSSGEGKSHVEFRVSSSIGALIAKTRFWDSLYLGVNTEPPPIPSSKDKDEYWSLFRPL